MVKIAIQDARLLGELIPPAERTFTLLLCDAEDKIRAAAEAGYDGVALIASEIERYVRQHSSEEMVSLLDKYQISVSEIACPVDWHYEGEGRKKAMEETRKAFSYASLFGRDVIALVVLPTHEGNISLPKRDFGEICKMAADYGLSVAFEFLGFGTYVKDIKQSRIVTEEPANGGICLDTHHFYRGGSTLEDLDDFPIEKILTAHFCDFPQQWTDPGDCWDRPLPGKGVAPVKEIIDILRSKGYRGYYTLEVFNYELWGKDPGEVARIGKKVMEDLLGENR